MTSDLNIHFLRESFVQTACDRDPGNEQYNGHILSLQKYKYEVQNILRPFLKTVLCEVLALCDTMDLQCLFENDIHPRKNREIKLGSNIIYYSTEGNLVHYLITSH